MTPTSTSYLWREPKATAPFTTGISLHSHTNQSRETLDLIAELSTNWPLLQLLLRRFEDRSARLSGIRPNYAHGYWTPPLNPAAAFSLEAEQITRLDLAALVSLSDHDDIRAPELLRSIAFAPEIPISTEWTVPFSYTAPAGYSSDAAFAEAEDPAPSALRQGVKRDAKQPLLATCFHLGVHNLPAAEASTWMQRFAALAAMPASDLAASLRRNAILSELLAALHELPGVLLVFNHPLWDLYRIGDARHLVLLNEFLARNGGFLHALELNGLRNWQENRAVAALAARWNMLTISGGDRHGIEPNANINLSRATTFAGFVHEVRRERMSHVLFMPQYAEPWKHRILQSTLDAIRNHPHLPQGSQRWDERVFHPDADGNIKPLSSLWTSGAPTPFISVLLATVRLLGARPVSHSLRYAWSRNRTEATAQRLTLAAEA